MLRRNPSARRSLTMRRASHHRGRRRGRMVSLGPERHRLRCNAGNRQPRHVERVPIIIPGATTTGGVRGPGSGAFPTSTRTSTPGTSRTASADIGLANPPTAPRSGVCGHICEHKNWNTIALGTATAFTDSQPPVTSAMPGGNVQVTNRRRRRHGSGGARKPVADNSVRAWRPGRRQGADPDQERPVARDRRPFVKGHHSGRNSGRHRHPPVHHRGTKGSCTKFWERSDHWSPPNIATASDSGEGNGTTRA